MKRKCKKLKQTKQAIKPRKSDIMRKPQFSKKPIPRKREIKKFYHVSPPQDIDATGEVLLGTAVAGPVGALIGLGLATARTVGHMGTTTVETVRDTAHARVRKLKKKS